jgi:hypothetical protein
MIKIQCSPIQPLLTPAVTCMGDYRQGFGLEIGFTDHFNTQLVITLNYSTIANFHTLQITTAHAKSFQSAVSSPVVPLLKAYNGGNSSTAPTKSSLH